MKRQLSLLTLITAIALLASGVGGAIGTSAGFQAGAKQQSDGLSASPLVPVGSGVGYQGQLVQGGVVANGQYDFTFTLYDALAGGNQVGSPVNLPNQQVTNGLFNVSLDFGPDVFLGEARWLELAVRVAGGGAYTTLTPRQPLGAAPYAQSAPWRGVSNKPWTFNVKRAANTANIVDSAGVTGANPSLAIGADELGLISYYDTTNADLKVAHCNDVACTSATVSTLDSAGDVGNYSSIAIGADGLGLISYYDATNGNLKVAHCNNIACTTATLTTVSTSGAGGSWTSIAIGSDGLGLALYRGDNGAIESLHCLNTECTSTVINYVGGTQWAFYISLAIGADGLPLFSYFEGINTQLVILHCEDLVCSSTTGTNADNRADVGRYNSITIGGDGLGLVSYQGPYGTVSIAHCNNVRCTSATVSEVGNFNMIGSSIATKADGLGVIVSKITSGSGLLVSHCANLPCTSVTEYTLESTGDVGYTPAVSIGTDGLPLISHFDNTNGDLRVLHCSNPLCVPFQNGR